MKIVVTGGAGLIGSFVVDYLLSSFGKKISQVVVFDNFTRGKIENLNDAKKNKLVEVVHGDVRDIKQVNKVIKGADYVIHEAAIRITQCAEDPRLCNEVLIDGTFNVLESCVKHKVKKLIFNSSASVYGQPFKLPMSEDDPFNNDTAYGAAKIANEQMAKSFRKMYGLNYVCLRVFNVYGPRMDIFGVYTEVLIRWLERIDHDLPPIIFGDGENTLDFIYVEDVAWATICALKSSVNEGVFNVGSGRETSLKELVNLVLGLTNPKLQAVFEPEKLKTNYATRRQADIRRARKYLKFKAQTSLKQGLKKLIEWRKEKTKK